MPGWMTSDMRIGCARSRCTSSPRRRGVCSGCEGGFSGRCWSFSQSAGSVFYIMQGIFNGAGILALRNQQPGQALLPPLRAGKWQSGKSPLRLARGIGLPRSCRLSQPARSNHPAADTQLVQDFQFLRERQRRQPLPSFLFLVHDYPPKYLLSNFFHFGISPWRRRIRLSLSLSTASCSKNCTMRA